MTEGLQKAKINPLHQKHEKVSNNSTLLLFHPLCFSSSSTFSALLHLHLSSFTPLLPLPRPSSLDLRKIGTWERFESTSLLWSSKGKQLLHLFPPFSRVSGGERTLEQQRMWCCENPLSYQKSPHKSPWNKKAPCGIVKKDPCTAITFIVLGRKIPFDNHSYCG